MKLQSLSKLALQSQEVETVKGGKRITPCNIKVLPLVPNQPIAPPTITNFVSLKSTLIARNGVEIWIDWKCKP